MKKVVAGTAAFFVEKLVLTNYDEKHNENHENIMKTMRLEFTHS